MNLGFTSNRALLGDIEKLGKKFKTNEKSIITRKITMCLFCLFLLVNQLLIIIIIIIRKKKYDLLLLLMLLRRKVCFNINI